jgi:hypothetical protein
VVTQNYQFCGGQTASFFINEILLPDSSGYKLRTVALLLFKRSTDSGGPNDGRFFPKQKNFVLEGERPRKKELEGEAGSNFHDLF